MREVEPSPGFYRTPRILDALFGGGDAGAAAQAVRELSPSLEAALQAPRDQLPAQGPMLCAVMLWRVAEGVPAGGKQAVDRLGELARTPGRENLSPKRIAHLCQATLAASLAAMEGGPGATPALERLDSLTAVGASAPLAFAAAANFTAARLLEGAGDLEDALAAIRRHVHFQGTYHSTRLAEEGRLAERLGRRDDAIRAYQHYLTLRRNPEPSVRPEVDRVKSALAQLLGEPRSP
jgi:tetratricopeptide (TPR) repeat protein